MVMMPARDVWSRAELINMARALAFDAPEAERRAYAKLLAAVGVELAEIRQTVSVRVVDVPMLEK